MKNKTITYYFASILEDIRKSKKLSKEKFAFEINISPRFYEYICSGERGITLVKVRSICENLNLNYSKVIKKAERLLKAALKSEIEKSE